jgi:acetyl esterase/lipase
VAGGIVAVLAVATTVSFVNPWPSALLIRTLFEANARQTVTEMQKYVPASGVRSRTGIAYAPGGTDTTLDWFAPEGAVHPRTTVIWIHGGAWISGSSQNVDPYLRIIASHGFTAIALNYTVAPEARYPTALGQLDTALAYLLAHTRELGIDPDRIVLAGDSAGAQYAAQLAVAVTNPAYADEFDLHPPLNRSQLRAVVLDCGIYDVRGIPDAPGIGGWGFRTALWSYLGTKDWSHTTGGRAMTTISAVTADFPRTWISGGNADPLTDVQSKPFAARLSQLGVAVEPVFYPADEQPALPHEYQFHLDDAAARSALDSTIAFLRSVDG